MEKGDKVHYIPDIIHALHKDRSGNYPWAIGRKELVQRVTGGRAFMEERVVELEGIDLENFLEAIKRHPNPAEESRRIAFIRPVRYWPATVREVNQDGTVHLDVEVGNGFTLHYNNIVVGEGPHSCMEVIHGGS